MKGFFFAEISPRETYLASSRIFSDEISFWHLSSGKISKKLQGASRGVQAAVFSPDEKYFAAVGMKGTLTIWNIQAEEVIVTEQIPIDQFEDMQFVDDALHLKMSDGNRRIVFDS